MNIEYIAQLAIPQELRIRQANGYNHEYKDFELKGNETITLKYSRNEVFFLVEADEGIVISSRNGDYAPGRQGLTEQEHKHEGKILLENKKPTARRLQFVRLSVEV